MELVTRRGKLEKRCSGMYSTTNPDLHSKSRQQLDRLDALGPSPTPDQFADAFPELKQVVSVQCNECGKYTEQAMNFHDRPEDHHDRDYNHLVCGNCLILALNLHEENC